MAATTPVKLPIPAAKLVSSKTYHVPGKLCQTELWFEVPLDYANPTAGSIKLFGRRATRRESPLVSYDQPPTSKPYIVYLQGGPGFGCSTPNSVGYTDKLIDKGYQVLYLDHRGVGLSTPVSLAMLRQVSANAEGQANYLSLMRQDNTVRDLEAVRQCLNEGLTGEKAKWSIIGQSYGGFVCLSYLSMHPEGLLEAYLTGGLAPVGRTADEVYQATMAHTVSRNEDYYKKFPQDVDRVRKLAGYIESKGGVPLPGGGTLTVARLMTIGISLASTVALTLCTMQSWPWRLPLINLASSTAAPSPILKTGLHLTITSYTPFFMRPSTVMARVPCQTGLHNALVNLSTRFSGYVLAPKFPKALGRFSSLGR